MATLVLKLGDRELQRCAITKTQTWIGRDITCDVVIDNDAVSRKHAMIAFEDGRFSLFDNGSGNGTVVNGVERDVALLNNGSEILIGKFTVVFLTLGGVQPETLQTMFFDEGDDTDKGHATTHLDPEYMEKVRAKLEQRARERPQTVPRKPTTVKTSSVSGGGGMSATVLVLVGIVIGVGAAVLLYFLRGE